MSKRFKIITSIFFIFLLLSLAACINLIIFRTAGNAKIILLIAFSFIAFVSVLFIVIISYTFKKQRVEIKKSFDYYTEELISQAGVGLIIFNAPGTIIWVSNFITERFSESLIGKSIVDISESFREKFYDNNAEFRFEFEKSTYAVTIFAENKSITLKDVTEEETILHQYIQERPVIGELDIDNFQQYQASLPEEELFAIQSVVIKFLDFLVEKYSIAYRQYTNGKYLIFTDKVSLNDMIEKQFSFLSKINKKISGQSYRLTASIGFGADSSVSSELMQLAKDAVFKSQSRGGGQVTIQSPYIDPIYFGAKTESVQIKSRVKIRQIAESIEGKLKSSSIDNVIVYGHKHADLDSLGAAYGIVAIAKKNDVPIYIQCATMDSTTKKAIAKYLDPNEIATLFIKPTRAQKLTNNKTMVIIVDTSHPSRTENPNAFKGAKPENIFILDHHRLHIEPTGVEPDNIFVDPGASSASEIVTEVLQFQSRQMKLTKSEAQLILSGIYLDTKQFQRQVSSKTFAAASWLEQFGSTSIEASELLKIPADASKVIQEIIAKVVEVKPGYFLSAIEAEVVSEVISIAADEILRTSGRVASFVIAKLPGENKYKMSARSIGVNVQIIAERVGGGGHYSVAAALTDEPLSTFKDNVIQAIASEGR